jgi:hypothetical protein
MADPFRKHDRAYPGHNAGKHLIGGNRRLVTLPWQNIALRLALTVVARLTF